LTLEGTVREVGHHRFEEAKVKVKVEAKVKVKVEAKGLREEEQEGGEAGGPDLGMQLPVCSLPGNKTMRLWLTVT